MIKIYEYIQSLELNPMHKRFLLYICINSEDDITFLKYKEIEGVCRINSHHYYTDALKRFKKLELLDYRSNGRGVIINVLDKFKGEF